MNFIPNYLNVEKWAAMLNNVNRSNYPTCFSYRDNHQLVFSLEIVLFFCSSSSRVVYRNIIWKKNAQVFLSLLVFFCSSVNTKSHKFFFFCYSISSVCVCSSLSLYKLYIYLYLYRWRELKKKASNLPLYVNCAFVYAII